LVAALGHVRHKRLRAVIIGDGPERINLVRQIKEAGLEKRVSLLGAADEETVLRHYGRCLAVFFCPQQEDYGLVTVEAFASRKAVITASDSGGPVELVREGETGFVVEPNPVAVADRIDQLASSPRLAEEMGKKAFQAVSGMTWEKAVRRLLLAG
ncbi:MAG: glycosyltransferase, partial [Candidatus Aminicenantales bacterium]